MLRKDLLECVARDDALKQSFAAADRMFRGDFTSVDDDLCRTQSRVLKVFFSSTFTDTHAERNMIMSGL